jgi:hypothetical protein
VVAPAIPVRTRKELILHAEEIRRRCRQGLIDCEASGISKDLREWTKSELNEVLRVTDLQLQDMLDRKAW